MSSADANADDTASCASLANNSASTVKEKILRRAELNRITRMLKSRLEIAHFKVGRAWQNVPFKDVEPQLEREAKLRRPEVFEEHEPSQSMPTSSPPREAEFLVPSLPNRGRTNDEAHGARRGNIHATTVNGVDHTRQKVSPLKRHRSPSLDRETQCLGSSPLKYHASSSNLKERVTLTSPTSRTGTPQLPSTPPPASSHFRNPRMLSSSHHHKADTEEGADLLLYLATSPSPAKSRRSNRALEYSSPPPMRGSSAVNTPVGAGFNLSEFLNFSPSPAQLPRGRFDGNKFSPAKLTYDESPTKIGKHAP